MATHATASFTVQTWDEKSYEEIEGGAKLTRASVTYAYYGDIEGQGTSEALMFYREDGSAAFVGLERVVGRIHHRSGSFVLQGSGTYEGGIANNTSVVVPGSGTGDLRGLRGEVHFASGHANEYTITLDYEFENQP